MIHKNIQVTGKVQGVFFRDSTRQKANELGITGFVQNEKDGSVYIEAEGPATAMQQFESWVHHGPEQARVDNVNSTEAEVVNFEDFEVRRV